MEIFLPINHIHEILPQRSSLCSSLAQNDITVILIPTAVGRRIS